jgi:hypothetical protein
MHLELDVAANTVCPEILLEVYLDTVKIYQSTDHQFTHTIACDINEDTADHVMTLVMSGKNRKHTQVDESGKIVRDVYLQVDRLEFEGLDMREFFCLGNPCYTHSFNSTRPKILDEFYGMIGCNGQVEIRFSTPIFLWLGQHLD